jgi:heptaprenyl diphosphate synthase
VDANRLARLSLLAAMGIALHLLEASLPNPLPLPGAKLGLANIVVLVAIVWYGLRDGLKVTVARCVLSSFVMGSFLGVTFWLSLAGGVAATVVMGLAYRYAGGAFSLVGLSVLGATAHNLGQLAVAAVVIGSGGVLMYYLPMLLLFALPAGVATGLVARGLLARHPAPLGEPVA